MQFEDAVREFIENGGDGTAAYGALCNTAWACGAEKYSCSWRYAGGLVSNRDESYLDHYCSGNEGKIDEKFAAFLKSKGWAPVTEIEL
jgi:hypothetical protein